MDRLAKIVWIFLFVILAFLPCYTAFADGSSSTNTTITNSDTGSDKTSSYDDTSTVYEILDPTKKVIESANEALNQGTTLPEEEKASWYIFGNNCAHTSDTLMKYTDNCWMCVIFEKIFDAINELSYSVWEASRLEFLGLAAVLFAIWMAYHLLGHLGSLTPQSPEEFWTKIGHGLFRLMFVSVIFLTPNSLGNFIGNWIISPVVIGASEFTGVVAKSFAGISQSFSQQAADQLLQLTGTGDSHQLRDNEGNPTTGTTSLTREEINELRTELKTLQGYDCPDDDTTLSMTSGYMHCTAKTQSDSDQERIDEIKKILVFNTLTSNNQDSLINDCTSEIEVKAAAITAKAKVLGDKATLYGTLTPETKGALMCMIESIHREAAFGTALADSLLCYSWHGYIVKIQIPFLFFNLTLFSVALPDFTIMIAGAMLWVGCFILGLIFFTKLIDACLRLGVFCTLMPILLVAYIFPSTAMFAKNAVKVFIHVVVTFIILSIIMALVVLLLMQAFQVESNFHNAAGYTYDIRTLFYLNRMDLVADHLSLTGAAFLTALACIFFGWLITNQTDDISAQFTGVSDALARSAGFGNAVGDSVTKLAKSGTSLARGGVTGVKTMASKLMGKR